MDCAQLSSEGDLADVRILAEVVLVIHLVQNAGLRAAARMLAWRTGDFRGCVGYHSLPILLYGGS